MPLIITGFKCDGIRQVRHLNLPPPRRLRVNLSAGDQVRVTPAKDKAVILKSAASTPPIWQCSIIETGQISNFTEESLRPAPTDPLERFQAGQIGDIRRCRLQEVTRWYRQQHQDKEMISLGQEGVVIKPHQVSVAHKVVSSYPHRFLLCDEVGLGKTIEAGMILKELRARGGAQKVLIIAPPSLVGQWQFEMKTKFNENFVQISSGQDNPFLGHEKVICSSNWVARDNWANLCAKVNWDLVIVDEAHHARRTMPGMAPNSTQFYKLVEKLSDASHVQQRAMLLLTATPIQLNTYELYSLVELLDPALFASDKSFNSALSRSHELSRLVRQLSDQGFSPQARTAKGQLNQREIVGQVAKWLNLEASDAKRRLSAGDAELKKIIDELTDRHFLSQIMVRNRKRVIGGFTRRIATKWPVTMTKKEWAAQTAVDGYVDYIGRQYQQATSRKKQAIGFTMTIFQKLKASSNAAITQSLVKRRNKLQENNPDAVSLEVLEELEDLVGDDAENTATWVTGTNSVSSSPGEELGYIDRALKALDQVKTDSKARAMLKELGQLFEEHPNEKVLIFTQYLETQQHLANLIIKNRWGVNLFNGTMKAEEKDHAVARFKNENGPQVLISTEAGGEGRNFQFCHILVNYDLPWNPMKVEQRIGRVDRLGQKHKVYIFNLWVKESVEAKVLDVLDSRIRVFTESIGSLEPILGEFESNWSETMRRPIELRDAEIAKIEQKYQKNIDKAREAEGNAENFIMDASSMRSELAARLIEESSPISNDALEHFFYQLLFEIRARPRKTNGVYLLDFSGSHDWVKNMLEDAPGNTLERKVVFRPDHYEGEEEAELMVFGHPIVEAAVKQVLGEDYSGNTGTRRIPAGEDLAPTAGWLFTYHFTIHGSQTTAKLLPLFVSDAGEADLDLGRRLVERAGRFDPAETAIARAAIPDNLLEVKPIADQVASAQSLEIRQRAQDQAAEQSDREIPMVSNLFDDKMQVALDKVEFLRDKCTELREEHDAGKTWVARVLPTWEANLRRAEELAEQLPIERQRRLEELKQSRPQVSYALRSLGRIEVVASD